MRRILIRTACLIILPLCAVGCTEKPEPVVDTETIAVVATDTAEPIETSTHNEDTIIEPELFAVEYMTQLPEQTQKPESAVPATTERKAPQTTRVTQSTAPETTRAPETTYAPDTTTQEPDPQETIEPQTAYTLIGRMKVTGYTHEEGFRYGQTTASGVGCREGICALNNTRRKELGIKYGDFIYIEGLGTYQVQDCGCSYNTVDVWFWTNKEAYAITGYYDVYIVN